ncbi:hypothetical protein TSAR_014393, partial [Trichomalopsis sarcophagae]
MSRSTKWKLAIVAGISECLVYAEAKHCAFEINREPKYYVSKNRILLQLWLLRITRVSNLSSVVVGNNYVFGLLWWWLVVSILVAREVQSSSICHSHQIFQFKNPKPSSRSNMSSTASSDYVQYSKEYRPFTQNVERINYKIDYKLNQTQRSASSPAYSAAGAASSAAHYQNTSVVLNDANCPYYQLYGPPPSYETVIAQTRGKISSPSSPELQPRSSPAAQPAAMRGCFYPTVSSLLPPPPPPPPLEAPQYQASPPKDFDTAEYVRLYSRLQQQYSPRHQLYQPAPYNVA